VPSPLTGQLPVVSATTSHLGTAGAAHVQQGAS